MTSAQNTDYFSLETKWIEFVGVADEFKMLRNKWDYLSLQPNSMLPQIETVFERMNRVIGELSQLFNRLGFSRHEVENRTNFVEHEMSRHVVKGINGRFLELCHYHGILKTTFYMRTVSSEIPHVVSGAPLSPEKTMGNEAAYFAADNVAKRYKACLHVPDEFIWDHYVSFLYPSSGFYGAFCSPQEHLRLFHLSISEEGKNFLGLYLVLPHELAHMCHIKLGRENLNANWFKRIFQELGPRLRFHDSTGAAVDIPDTRWIVMFQQFIADILGLMIGGITTLHLYNDLMFIDSCQYLRNCFLYGYFSSIGDPVTDSIRSEIEILENRRRFFPETNMQWDNLRQFGISLGSRFRELTQNLVNNESRDQLDLPSNTTTGNDLISHLVKQRFHITIEEENELCNSLQRGKIVNDVDPAKILHAFYRNFRLNRPNNYSATLFSLANSSFLI